MSKLIHSHYNTSCYAKVLTSILALQTARHNATFHSIFPASKILNKLKAWTLQAKVNLFIVKISISSGVLFTTMLTSQNTERALLKIICNCVFCETVL